MAFMRAMRCERDLYGSRERELQTACCQVDSSEVDEGEQEEGGRRVYKEREREPIEVLSCLLHHAIKPSSNTPINQLLRNHFSFSSSTNHLNQNGWLRSML